MIEQNFNESNFEEKVEKNLKLLLEHPQKFENIFTELFDQDFVSQLNYIKNLKSGDLRGLIITIKDLFDVKGYRTRGGSIFIDPTASNKDAECIALLRNSGGLLFGHTNMTELAYSGLGINPHYGTPENPIYKGSVPGGSTSGGAVSIATGIADITIGTDTGGSTRIPAAYTGITGFKPTQDSISRNGCLTLSNTLDSVGVMAKNIKLCRLAFEVMRKDKKILQDNNSSKNITLTIPKNFGFDDIQPDVEQGFDLAKKKIIDAGINIEEVDLPILESYKKIPLWQFAAVECQTEYYDSYLETPDLIDPNILKRMDRANEVKAVEYALLLKIRQKMITNYNENFGNHFLLMPTVTIKPPLIKDCNDTAFYDEANLISLKNTTLANFMNGCSISIPFKNRDTTLGIMINGSTNMDQNLLDIGTVIEEILNNN
ncbi:amidase family protein [Alphaproteobacteria bacterium]|nr:amidase family protein [Alphaproteobacteria bacterium]